MSEPATGTSSKASRLSEGTLLAGVLSAAGALLGILWLFGGLPRDPSALALSFGAVVGAGVGLALFWRLLVPRRGQYRLPGAVLAGIAGALFAHLLAWLAFFLAGSLAAAESFPDMARAFGFTITMLGMSMILAGVVSVPAAIAIAVVVTLWCRRQAGP